MTKGGQVHPEGTCHLQGTFQKVQAATERSGLSVLGGLPHYTIPTGKTLSLSLSLTRSCIAQVNLQNDLELLILLPRTSITATTPIYVVLAIKAQGSIHA